MIESALHEYSINSLPLLSLQKKNKIKNKNKTTVVFIYLILKNYKKQGKGSINLV
jgi:hypothetical protein